MQNLSEESWKQLLADPHSAVKLGKGLIKIICDDLESVREMGAALFLKVCHHNEDSMLALLPYTIPVLEERLIRKEGSLAPPEPCEEVRWKLVLVLRYLVSHVSHAIDAWGSEVVELSKVACEDTYHDINIEACGLVRDLAGVLGLRLGALAKELIASLLPLTTHRRFKVRVAAVEAVQVVMHLGAHDMILEMTAFRDPNCVPIKAFYGDDVKVNFCGKLATDQNVQVRVAFLQMIGDWLLHLPERVDHESRLLPYLLSALHDDDQQVRGQAWRLLEEVGGQYEKEHEKDLRDLIQYFPEHLQTSVLGGKAPRVVYAREYGSKETEKEHAGGQTRDMHIQGQLHPIAMPSNIPTRPRWGTRMVVQSNFERMVKAICNELTSWQEQPRQHSSQLLCSLMGILEDKVQDHANVLIPALCKAVRTCCNPSLEDCCTILGAYCPTRSVLSPWVSFLKECNTAGDLLLVRGSLQVVSWIVHGAGASPEGRQEMVQQVLAVLVQDELLNTDDSGIRYAIIDCTKQLLRGFPELAKEGHPSGRDLLLVLLHACSSDKLEGNVCLESSMREVQSCMSLWAHLMNASRKRSSDSYGKPVDEDYVIHLHRDALVPKVLGSTLSEWRHQPRKAGVLCRLYSPWSYAANFVDPGCLSWRKGLVGEQRGTDLGLSVPGLQGGSYQCSGDGLNIEESRNGETSCGILVGGNDDNSVGSDHEGWSNVLVGLLKEEVNNLDGASILPVVVLQLMLCLEVCLQNPQPGPGERRRATMPLLADFFMDRLAAKSAMVRMWALRCLYWYLRSTPHCVHTEGAPLQLSSLKVALGSCQEDEVVAIQHQAALVLRMVEASLNVDDAPGPRSTLSGPTAPS